MPNTRTTVGVALDLETIFYDEWVSVEDAQFIIGDELKIALTLSETKALGQRFGCFRIDGKEFEIQHGPFVEMCRKAFFVDIPKGWKSLERLAKMFKVSEAAAEKWAKENKVKAQIFSIGLKEVWFAEEKDFRRYSLQQRSKERKLKFGKRHRDSKTKRYLVANGFYDPRPRSWRRKGSGARSRPSD